MLDRYETTRAVMRVLTSVQALRAFAAFLVICVHVGNPDGFEVRYLHATTPLLGGFVEIGRTGVDLFLIISGFIMTVTSFGRATIPSSSGFLLGRVIRIYPPLWIVTSLILVVYLHSPGLVNSHSAFPPDIAASFLALPQRGSPLLLVGWSLTFEMYFYCIFALALQLGKRMFIPVLGAWAAATIALNVGYGASMNPWLALMANPLCFEFLLGVLVGLLVIAGRYGEPLAWVVLGAAWYTGEALLGFGSGWSRVVEAIPLALIVYGAVGVEQRDGAVLPDFLTHLGDASYAVYLWHVPVLAILGVLVTRISIAHRSSVGEVVILAICFASVEAFGLGMYRYVERPLTVALRDALIRRRPFANTS